MRFLLPSQVRDKCLPCAFHHRHTRIYVATNPDMVTWRSCDMPLAWRSKHPMKWLKEDEATTLCGYCLPLFSPCFFYTLYPFLWSLIVFFTSPYVLMKLYAQPDPFFLCLLCYLGAPDQSASLLEILAFTHFVCSSVSLSYVFCWLNLA